MSAEKYFGTVQSHDDQVIFSMKEGVFLISSANKQISVKDHELIERNGKVFADISFFKFNDFYEIEIPEHILELKLKAREEHEKEKNSIAFIEHKNGRIYFSISEDCKIIARIGDLTVRTGQVYDIEGKRAIYVPEFELLAPFLEIPEIVETELKGAKKAAEMKKLCLIYAGRSLLTGKDYYRFSCQVPEQTFYRVKDCFEYFGEDKQNGTLYGYCTANPALVEERLRLRTHSIEERKTEIEKQKTQAVKAQKKIIETILKS